MLTTEVPADAGHETYLYDPRRPVPSAGGASKPTTPGFCGPVDQRTVVSRYDVLCFATPVLNEAVEVTDPVSLTLYVSSSAVDTDFTAKLVDVFPDGKAINLCDGILRTRYRGGLAAEELMEPGAVYEITVDMTGTSNVFLPGHRIRVDISSSNFPRYDRNDGTGFVHGLAAKDRQWAGRAVALAGAGGAGLALAAALMAAGTGRIDVTDPDPQRLAALLARLEPRWPGRVLVASGTPAPDSAIAVNATPWA
ncbi:CocE/NonD family hydrolase [Streptomyces sp. NPDC005799]|uniref:CocE/NonD family hydrolase n=1 Tax=Streptomyces sp. NPDC005799 TaxID=3154678 RepID=UPI0033C94B53